MGIRGVLETGPSLVQGKWMIRCFRCLEALTGGRAEAQAAESGIQTPGALTPKSSSSDWEHPVGERQHLIMVLPWVVWEMEYREPPY